MTKRMNKHSPLTEATYYILLSLLKPLHGYGIMKKVEQMSAGRVVLAAGTLYGALGALLDGKLITLIGEDESNKRRKMYCITQSGRALLEYEIARLREMYENGIDEMAGVS